MSIAENIKDSLDKIGSIDIFGIKLEQADPSLLDISRLTQDIHSIVQAPGLAYYGRQMRLAKRTVEHLERDFERWKSRKLAEALAALLATSSPYKPTKDDCVARMMADHGPEITDWDDKITKANDDADALESWYDAWKQRSYMLKQNAGWEKDELIASSESSPRSSSQNIRNLLKVQ